MKFSDKIMILLVLAAAIVHFTVLFLNIPDSKKTLKEAWQDGYNKGYMEYQIDTYVPAPGFEELKLKRRNPKLKEDMQ